MEKIDLNTNIKSKRKMTAKYIESKIDNIRYCKTNGQFTRHLRNHNLSYQEYYEKYITGKKELCDCGDSKTFYQKSESYASSCGKPACVGNTIKNVKETWTEDQKENDRKNKKKAAARRSASQVKEQIKKSKATQIKKYGKLAVQTDQFKEKTKATKLERYGNEYYSGWEKSAEKNRSKTVEEQNKINDKRRKTNLELFGVENVFLRPDVTAKAMQANSKGKEYTMPSGKVVHIRGYENKALDLLSEQGYAEGELIIDNRSESYNMPIFSYTTVKRQSRRYYPDIYIPKENKIIEVKSQWWWDAHGREDYKGRLENNLRKKQAVLNEGYKYEVWLFINDSQYEVII